MKRTILISLVLVFAFSTQAGLYRWVDETGNVHFSDKVPAAASKKKHAKLNKAGAFKKTVDPTSRQNEKDTLALIREERKKQEELRKIKYQAMAVIQKRDDYLLSTYENKNELMRSFETKIKMLQGNSKILEAQNKVLDKKVVRLRNKSKTSAIESKIKGITRVIAQYKQALSENDSQIVNLNTHYKTDLQRYIELTE